jgi:ABC-type transport system involved in multi-copper enzyme maturation permease subunit
MIWLTWRQHRRQVLFTGIALAVLAALMIPTGLTMRHSFTTLGLPACVAQRGHTDVARDAADACQAAFQRFENQYTAMTFVAVLFLVLPLLVALFWGAPLVAREVEQGTHRLAWTQGISRRHWALLKVGFVATVTLAAAITYGLGMSWWMVPLIQADNGEGFKFFIFDMQGVVPIGYTLFAVALGIFAGAFWPKMLPAMAVTLAGFTGLRIALTILARPRYLPARTRTDLVAGATDDPKATVGDWVLSKGVRDAAGTLVMPDARGQTRVGPGSSGAQCSPDALATCPTPYGPGAYNWELYQPASRFWLFQSIETGIYVAVAAFLLYLAVRRIRRIA